MNANLKVIRESEIINQRDRVVIQLLRPLRDYFPALEPRSLRSSSCSRSTWADEK
jgi:hypothetical protein